MFYNKNLINYDKVKNYKIKFIIRIIYFNKKLYYSK